MTAMVAALRVPKVRWGIGVLLGAGTFTSAALDTDDTFSHTYSAPGEYPYICTIHPYMVGKIIVKPRREIIVIGGPIRHDTLSKTRLRSNRRLGRRSPLRP